jgi:hypothetical protein
MIVIHGNNIEKLNFVRHKKNKYEKISKYSEN